MWEHTKTNVHMKRVPVFGGFCFDSFMVSEADSHFEPQITSKIIGGGHAVGTYIPEHLPHSSSHHEAGREHKDTNDIHNHSPAA